jgi:hypothetical protein
MDRPGSDQLQRAGRTRAFILMSVFVMVVAFPIIVDGSPELQEAALPCPEVQDNPLFGSQAQDKYAPVPVMLILRGIASPEYPRGQLDDDSALQYAQRNGYQGEVLDAAGNSKPESPQVKMALERIRQDKQIGAIYAFSGGGYSARRIWLRLKDAERRRIAKVVVVGSPGVSKTDFVGSADVLIKQDPPEGHMAGPKVLLESLTHPKGGLSAKDATTTPQGALKRQDGGSTNWPKSTKKSRRR